MSWARKTPTGWSWRRGDEAAFEAVVERWRRPVVRFLFRYTGRVDLVQDLCQEVFLRVYQAGPRYRETGTFPGWLFRIALMLARRRPTAATRSGAAYGR